MECFLLLIAALCVFDEPVLTTAAGESTSGQLISISASNLQWRSDEGTVTLTLDRVERIQFPGAETLELPTNLPAVQLVDGSLLRAATFRLKDDALASEGSEPSFSVKRRDIDVIRFADASDQQELENRWKELLEEEATGDVLAIRKVEESADGSSVTNLVSYEGVVLGIDNENVQFRFGETIVPVAKSRVFAIRLYQTGERDLEEPFCSIQLRNGSHLRVRQLELKDQRFTATTPAGMKSELNQDAIAFIDFALGRLAYLDQLEPLSFEWTPFFGSASTTPLLKQLNRFRKNQSFDGGPITLARSPSWDEVDVDDSSPVTDSDRDGLLQRFEHGLALRSQSRLVYSLGGNYSRFVSLAGIDPKSRPRGHVELVVTGDGRELFRTAVSGEDPQPTPVDVPIQGVQRLGIEVQFGEDLDVSDFLHLGRARVIK